MLALGLLSIAAAYLYTGGPKPYGYLGLGDLSVFLFFGFGAVTGTYFVQAHAVSALALWVSVPVGAYSLLTATMLAVAELFALDRVSFGVAAVASYLVLVTLEAVAVAREAEGKVQWTS